MADEKFYEQKLVNAIVDCLYQKKNSSKFCKAVQKRLSVGASICVRISDLINVSVSEAEMYINFETGQFKSGRYMPHCLDPKLKELFSDLEAQTKIIKSYPFKSASEAYDAVKLKTEKVSKTVDEIKKVFGVEKARGIATRAKAAAIKKTGIEF